MRLTLRTLLAYMDDILDPADQESLAKQVAESEKATELIHRTRDATRRLRLGAPPVIGDGMELDPNSAAEYLDSTMSADDMTEYQQVCLDSDVHLAEVASCHHILTMVLGEPAEIDPEMRQRMYGVPERLDEWRRLRLDGAHRATTSAAAPVAAAAVSPMRRSDSGEDEPITEVPDYLKAGERSGIGRVLMACAAALLLGFGAYALFGPDGMLTAKPEVAQNDPKTEGSATEQPAAAANDTADTDVEPVPDLSGESTAEPEIELGTPPTPPAANPATETPTAEAPFANEAGTGEMTLPPVRGLDENTAEATTPPVEPTTPPVTDTVPATTPDATAPDAASPDVAAATPSTMPDTVAQPVTPPVVETPPVAVAPRVEGTAATEPGTEATATAEPDRAAMNTDVPDPLMGPLETPDALAPATEGTGTAELPADAPLGTLVATDQVLLEVDPQSGEWFRLPPRASIVAGEQLLSLPTYRPSLALVSGLRVEFSNAASMTLGFAADGKTPRLDVAYGRFLLQNTGKEPSEIELVVGGESKRVSLASTAILGLDVDRPFVPGADVEASLGTFVAKFYAPNGGVTWDMEGLPTVVDKPSQWTWLNPEAASITDDVAWLDGQSLDYLEKNVSDYFEKQLVTTEPARVQLLELYETSRRREDKALAAECGTHVGQFVPFVQALADTQQQSSWDHHIAELQSAMSRSTQAAKLVHQTLIEQRGAALADDLFEMLRGYTPAQVGATPDEVRAGVTRKLIDWLEHDRLEYRVLAIHNLKLIYGGKTLGYNPVITEPSRQERAVKQWRARLADNELVPSAVETP
ncbi:hypothetical protein [Aeoliella sp. SH292]|uniref:hypothetical protein n=1 Tax=Aeoliella sp. SH292 TaxID=3454464 RepID=UPI003F95A8FA